MVVQAVTWMAKTGRESEVAMDYPSQDVVVVATLR